MRLNRQNLTWLAYQIIKKLGLLGLLGLFIALVCLLVLITKLIPQQNKIRDLVTQSHLLNANQHSQQTIQISNQENIAMVKQASLADFEKFYATFSNSESLPNTINLIRENAQKQKLVLTQGDYKLIQAKAALQASQRANFTALYPQQLAHYEIILPITGTYQQIRTFIADVLYQLPALALSDMQIKRENTLNPLVDARLAFTFLIHDNFRQKNITQGGQV